MNTLTGRAAFRGDAAIIPIGQALRRLAVPVGAATMQYCLMAGNLKPVAWSMEQERTQRATGSVALPVAAHLTKRREVVRQEMQQAPDPEWWGWEGELAYLACQQALLQAARRLNGWVPDLPFPSVGARPVMDAYSLCHRWAAMVAQLAQAIADADGPPAAKAPGWEQPEERNNA